MILLRLTAETCYDVGSYGTIRHGLANSCDTVQIPFPGIAATHLLQHHIAAGLDRQMDMTADIVILGHHVYHLVADIFRMGSRITDTKFRTDFRNH